MQPPGAHLKLIPAQHMLNSKITFLNMLSILPVSAWLMHISNAGKPFQKNVSENNRPAVPLFNTLTILLYLAGKMVEVLMRK